MAATIKELLGHKVAREVINRTETNPYQIRLIGIFAQRNRQFEPFYLLWYVYQAFGIAFNIIKALQLIAGERIECSIILGHIHKFLVHHIAHQADTILGIVVENIAIDAILVDMFGEQLTDDEVDFRARAVEGKTTCIGHHTTIHRHGKCLAELIKIAHLPSNSEHQFAGARCIRMRYNK